MNEQRLLTLTIEHVVKLTELPFSLKTHLGKSNTTVVSCNFMHFMSVRKSESNSDLFVSLNCTLFLSNTLFLQFPIIDYLYMQTVRTCVYNSKNIKIQFLVTRFHE